jgi:quinoprotein glucose dehydrogenase
MQLVMFVTALLALLVLAACGRDVSGRTGPPSVAKTNLALDTVASGLEVPWAMDFAPDGRLFVTERPGRIRVVEHGTLRREPWATLSVDAIGEDGLMGIAIAPDFATTHFVYVVGTFRLGSQLVNRVLRLTDRDGAASDERQIVVDNIPSGALHAGDALAFGPDDALYVATGDAREPRRAQDTSSLGGKILRDSRIFALGFRNPQGLAWHPETKELFATEHGPSGFANEGFRRDHDELNVVVQGGNYGWPVVSGMDQSTYYRPPIAVWTPAIAPSGLAFYSGTEFPEWRGNAFVGALRGEQLRRIALARDPSSRAGWRVAAQEALFEHELGRIRAVRYGPDGHLYFTTSNRDDRGKVRPGDDKIFRLRRRTSK